MTTLPSADISEPLDSPCIGICSTLFDEECQGCGRTATEVANWVGLSQEEKRAIWERIQHEGRAIRFTRCAP